MRYASIDIGTNTILMLIADIDGLRINRIEDFYEVPRVGKNVSSSKRLAPDSIGRGMVILQKYKKFAHERRVDRIIASATSAIRDAANREDFIIPVKEKFGIDVEVIDGETEAKLVFMGALSDKQPASEASVVIDIGGGSTEISYGLDSPELATSIDIGAVRITETYFKHNPPEENEMKKASDSIEIAVNEFQFGNAAEKRFLSVGGTATTLALIAQGKAEFEPKAVDNYYMPLKSLREVFSRIRSKTPTEIRKLTSAADGREDVLLAGSLILLKILEAAHAPGFVATDRGLRYGYLLYKHKQFAST